VQLVVGNWKMNGLRSTAVELARAIASSPAPQGVRLAVAPPFPFLEAVLGELARGQARGGGPIELAAQDCAVDRDGAQTGDVSAEMLASAGCRRVIVGHSERRAARHETDDLVAKKLRAVLRAGLSPILCVGEVLEQRDAGRHEEVVSGQVRAALEGLDAATVSRVVLAYEPVWAIGTGRVAKPEQAGEMHRCIRSAIGAVVSTAAAEEAVILYGGSVKPDNMPSLAAVPGVDGALVGGASLDAASFLAIASSARAGELSRSR
jgi:triosephosphate isomerase